MQASPQTPRKDNRLAGVFLRLYNAQLHEIFKRRINFSWWSIMSNSSKGAVVLGFGPQSIDFITKATELLNAFPDVVMDSNVARMAGASIAIGDKASLECLRQTLAAPALAAAKQSAGDAGLSPQAVQWLATGDRGASSEALFSVLSGFECADGSRSLPQDPDDFKRCLVMLEACPELSSKLPHMATVNPTWSVLISHWEELKALLEAEAPDWRKSTGSCPQLYERLQALTRPIAG